MRIGKLVDATVAALEDIKARDIVVLDVRRMTAFFDRIIIASADSPPGQGFGNVRRSSRHSARGLRVEANDGRVDTGGSRAVCQYHAARPPRPKT